MVAKIDRFESSDLPPKHKAALRLADAMMTQPGAISVELRDELAVHFSREQIIELTVDVMKWNYQKVPVALGTDDEIRPGELTDLRFDENGHFVRPATG